MQAWPCRQLVLSARRVPTSLDHTEPFCFIIIRVGGNLCFQIKETRSTAHPSRATLDSESGLGPHGHGVEVQQLPRPPATPGWGWHHQAEVVG